MWEISQKKMMNLAIARGPYICQSQSLNLYMENPVFNKMSLMHFSAWRSGLKTGQYYFRSRPARDAIKFTVNVDMLLKAADGGNTNQVMECLNVENKGKDQKKKNRTAKPASLETANMNNPNGPKLLNAANQDEEMKENPADTNGNGSNMAKAGNPTAGTVNAKEDDSDSSEAEFECQACSA